MTATHVLCPITRRTLERRAEAIKRWWPGWDSVHTDARELVRREREFKRIVARLNAAAPAPAGLVYTGRCKATGATITVYDRGIAGTASTGRWRTVCETHGETACHRSRQLAMRQASVPEWCQECRDIMRPLTLAV